MDLNEVHDKAMDLAAEADRAGFADDRARELELLDQAYRLERQVADSLAEGQGEEPSRSIIHRSAAWLALQSGHAEEAAELARRGLRPDSPESVAGELREVLQSALRRMTDRFQNDHSPNDSWKRAVG